MHQQQQHLQSAITTLSSSSPLKLSNMLRCITLLVKTLDKYNTNPDILPSQRFIPCCLFVLPNRFKQLLSLQENQLLQDKPQKMGVKLALAMYLKGLGKLVTQADQQIKHVVVQGMSKSILLAAAYPVIIKKWVKVLLQLWSTSHQNLELALRCHLCLAKYLQKCNSQEFMWCLRRSYIAYFQNSKQVSWRNLQHINFMINSFCEFTKFNPQRSYYVLFGYLRSIALQLDKLHKSKRRQKIEQTSKLFSNQVLNSFKLLTAVATRVDSQQLTAIIYPLCEMFAAYERITQAPEYIPLKLHILEYQLTIVESLGIFIPHVIQMIEKMVKMQIFNRKIPKKSQKLQANIQLAYKVSKAELGQALLVNELFRSLITKIYWLESLMCKSVSGSQVIMKLHKILKSHKFVFSEYQQQAQKLASTFKQDGQTLYSLRASQKMSLLSNKKHQIFEQKTLKSTKFQGPIQYLKLKQAEQQLLRQKLAAQQQDKAEQQQQAQKQHDDGYGEDQDQLNSGWDQQQDGDGQGASEMDIKEIQGSDQDQAEAEQGGDIQDVSYQGDPQDADQIVKQWSEEEWSSQNDINQM